MQVQDPRVFLDRFKSIAPRSQGRTMRAAMLVTPSAFRVNEDSARDNHYMVPGTAVDGEGAMREHQSLARLLGELGLPVLLFPGLPGLEEAVFPNNAYGTTPGRLIVGRMCYPVRRREAERTDIRSLFCEGFGYELVDLSQRELIAELTGVLILDRARDVGFCGLSHRVDAAGTAAMDEAFGLELTLPFELVDEEYHANIVLAILAGRACVLHAPSFVDDSVPELLAACYPGRTLFLDDNEKNAFVGNCIAATEGDLLMSGKARDSLRPSSLASLESWGFKVHGLPLTEIEKGGGSLRCMVAEVF